MGTPKTLEQAILNGLITPENLDPQERAAYIADHIRDFLSQRFQVSYCESTPDQIQDLMKLWKSIIKEGV